MTAYITGSGLVCSDGTSQTTFPIGINDVGQYRLCFYPIATNGATLAYANNTGIAGSSLYYDVNTSSANGYGCSAVRNSGNPGYFPGISAAAINFGSWRSMHAFQIYVQSSTSKSGAVSYNTWWPVVVFQRYA